MKTDKVFTYKMDPNGDPHTFYGSDKEFQEFQRHWKIDKNKEDIEPEGNWPFYKSLLIALAASVGIMVTVVFMIHLLLRLI